MGYTTLDEIDRKTAITQGIHHYFTGIKCRNGHLSPRTVSDGKCVECRKASRVKNSAKIAAYNKEYNAQNYSTESRRQRYRQNIRLELFNGAKARSKNIGRDFDIDVEDIVIPESCPILGIPLDTSDRNHAPSLDRKDNDRGYVKGNVFIISKKANRLKSDGSIEDFQKIIKYMRKTGGGRASTSRTKR